MASSCCALAPFSLPIPHLRCAVRSSNAVGMPRKTHCFGIPLLAERRLVARPRRSVLVSSLGNAKIPFVTGKSWENLVLESETPVLVEFYARWCGPCRMVHRVIDEIATDYSGRLKCFVIDADSDSQLAESYDIRAVPVVLLFKNGEKYDSVLGTMPKEFYAAAIEKLLAP